MVWGERRGGGATETEMKDSLSSLYRAVCGGTPATYLSWHRCEWADEYTYAIALGFERVPRASLTFPLLAARQPRGEWVREGSVHPKGKGPGACTGHGA